MNRFEAPNNFRKSARDMFFSQKLTIFNTHSVSRDIVCRRDREEKVLKMVNFRGQKISRPRVKKLYCYPNVETKRGRCYLAGYPRNGEESMSKHSTSNWQNPTPYPGLQTLSPQSKRWFSSILSNIFYSSHFRENAGFLTCHQITTAQYEFTFFIFKVLL